MKINKTLVTVVQLSLILLICIYLFSAIFRDEDPMYTENPSVDVVVPTSTTSIALSPTPMLKECEEIKKCGDGNPLVTIDLCNIVVCCEIDKKKSTELIGECARMKVEREKEESIWKDRLRTLEETDNKYYLSLTNVPKPTIFTPMLNFQYNEGNMINTPRPSPTLTLDSIALSEEIRKMDHAKCRHSIDAEYSNNMNSCIARGAVDSYGAGGCDRYDIQKEQGSRYCNTYYNLCLGPEDCAKYGP